MEKTKSFWVDVPLNEKSYYWYAMCINGIDSILEKHWYKTAYENIKIINLELLCEKSWKLSSI